jgi:hypothetical protein
MGHATPFVAPESRPDAMRTVGERGDDEMKHALLETIRARPICVGCRASS